VLAGLALVFFSAQRAAAHATPISYSPETESVLQKTPTEVRITFSEHIEPTASTITILDPHGAEVQSGKGRILPTDTHIFYVPLEASNATGTYTVSWQIVSADDGHFTKGAFIFSVGKQIPGASLAQTAVQVQHITSVPEAITLWLELLGQAILIGALGARFIILKKLLPGSEETRAFRDKRFSLLIVIGIALIALGTLSYLALKTNELEQIQNMAFWPTFRIFAKTVAGTFTLYRLGLAALFGIVFFALRKKSSGILTALVVLMMYLRARISHAAATTFHPEITIIIHTIHLFSKELWVGILVAIAILLLPLSRKMNSASFFAAISTGASKILALAFGAAGITGLYVIWLDLKTPANLFISEWGGEAIVLFLLTSIMFDMRLYHQFFADKAAVRAANGETKEAKPIRFFEYTITFEMLVAFAFLFITSHIIITTPPFPVSQYAFARHAESQGENIDLAVHPDEPNQFLLTFTPIPGALHTSINMAGVTLTNTERNIGPITATTDERFPGGYAFPINSLTLPGHWTVAVTGVRTGTYDAVASFSVNYPTDIATSAVDPEARHFGWFELFLAIIGIFIALLTAALYIWTKHLEGKRETLREPEMLNNNAHSGRALSAAFLALILMLFGLQMFFNQFIKTDFERQCEADGNFWLQSVPMRNGVALSPDTVTGCTLNVGLNHFADAREYSWFLRPTEAVADLALAPAKPVAGKPVLMTLSLTKIENGTRSGPVEDLTIEHDRIFHVAIIGADMSTFAHIHTEDVGDVTPEMLKSGRFPLRYTFPLAGRYTIAANYYIRGKQFIQQFFVDVSGAQQMPAQVTNYSRNKVFDGYDVTLSAPSRIKAGTRTILSYDIKKDGKPVETLEPYLAAAMHLSIIGSDLHGFIHSHAGTYTYIPGWTELQNIYLSQSSVNFHNHFVPDMFGPGIQARLVFPQPGDYIVFGEFKNQGKVIPTHFMVKVY